MKLVWIVPTVIGAFAVLCVLVLLVEAFLAMRNVPPFQNPDRTARTFGQAGPPLTYVVMGDSTAAGQGAPPEDGIAPRTARVLAQDRQVSLTNLGISGAVTKDVLTEQLPVARQLKPDVVLIAAGANNVTKLSSVGTVKSELGQVVDGLIAANCNVKVILTGSPDFGGATRLAQPLRALAGWRSQAIADGVEELATERQLTFAPIYRNTGPAFREDPSLLSEDRFHPNARGYALWLETLNPAIASALAEQPSHCR